VEWTDEMETVYWTYAHQNPLCDALAHDGRAHLRRMSDVIGRREFHHLDFYQESLRPAGVEYDLMMQLPWEVGMCRAVELSRTDRDFSEREMEVLATLQPSLTAAYRNAQDREQLGRLVAGLEYATDREGVGVVLLGPGRHVADATPRARAHLAAFLDVHGSDLPLDVRRWIDEERARSERHAEGAADPLVVERDGRRLFIRLIASERGDELLLEERTPAPLEPDPSLGLTQRETEVLRLIARGYTNREAARRMSVSANTVRKHLENAYAKLGVGTRTAAVATAFGGSTTRPT
jgi:DNA-binding CsgD family transcriptional regulator